MNSRIVHVLYLSFFVGLFFSFRAVTSISVGMLLIAGLLVFPKKLFSETPRAAFFFTAACIDLFLLSVVSLAYTNSSDLQWEHIRLQSGLVVIPIAVLLTFETIRQRRQSLLLHYSLLLFVACLYCIAVAFYDYWQGHGTSVFFYHQLVTPVKAHAVYYSVFVFVALLFLFDGLRNDRSLAKTIRIGLIVFFSVFLFLLSSRLVIIFYSIYLLFLVIDSFRTGLLRKKMAIMVLVLLTVSISLLLVTPNPISHRFRDLIKGQIGLVNKKQFSPSDYFNGVQLRLVEWRFVTAILSERETWVLGLSPGDAQQALNEKYISSDMYIGEKDGTDRGFIGYNTHNQFLQSLLQNGLIGMLIFLFAFISLATMAVTAKQRSYTVLIVLILAYSGIESILETQYGIVLFAFFPLFLYPKLVNS